MNYLNLRGIESLRRIIFLKIVVLSLILFLSCNAKNNGGDSNTSVGNDDKELYIISNEGNWPSFRGNNAAGVADQQNLPEIWDGKSGKNIKWKKFLPGLAHSSPVIWENKLFVTTAISSRDDVSFRHGLYGDGDASDDFSHHKWCLYCLDKKKGEFLWQRTVVEGIPKDKRHIKSTYANSTPATNGKYVVVFFGSQGLYVYDMDGNFIWKKDLGKLDCGAYDAPEYEWGTASSPIIYKNMVFVQCDTQNDSFILACDISTGETVWKTMRDELPSWGTPTVVECGDRIELVTNSSNYIYGYNPLNGNELWRLGGSSQITAPTPIYFKEIIVICSGRRPEAPLFVLKMGAQGDITLGENQTSNDFVLWSKIRRGPYMPTPLIYRNNLYVLQNNGRLDCYDLLTGEEFYRVTVQHAGGGFSASPVAADGTIYLPSEDGEIYVVESGKAFKLIAENDLGERVMATPAISDSILYIRAEHHLFAISN